MRNLSVFPVYPVSNLRITLVIASSVFCLAGLLYQSSQLLRQYMSGKTVVNIDVKRDIITNLPAITVCYPVILSMERASNISPVHQELFQNYRRIMELIAHNITAYGSYQKEIENIYKRFLGLVVGYILPMNNRQFAQTIFDELSLPFGIEPRQPTNHKAQSVQVNVFLVANQDVISEQLFLATHDDSYLIKDVPIESFYVKNNQVVKCFTFFSFEKHWRNVQVHLDKISVKIDMDINWIPPHLLTKYYVSIHSANIIPEFKVGPNFVQIPASTSTTFTYSKVTINRNSRVNHSSNCIDHNWLSYPNLTSDCMAVCLMNLVSNRSRWAIFETDYVLRRHYFDQVSQYKQTDLNKTKRKGVVASVTPWSRYNLDCIRQCRTDCRYTYYLFDTKEEPMPLSVLDKGSKVYIEHNRLPDIFVRHYPEMTFISFVSNFGGLLGMWLGISVLTIFYNMLALIRKMINALANSSRSFSTTNNINIKNYTINAKFIPFDFKADRTVKPITICLPEKIH